ncbi:MAG: protein phosphatase [Gemmataceae bacterium]
MAAPPYFSWIEPQRLAAMGRPQDEDLHWLRQQGIEVLVSLTEEPLPVAAVRDAGVLVYHVPVPDMTAPTQDDLARCISAIKKALARGMKVGVHCGAGMGRSGTVLACYFVDQGLPPEAAIAKIRQLRPGSIETVEQERAVHEFARRRAAGSVSAT